MAARLRTPVRLSLFWVGAWAALAFTTAARADFVTPASPQSPPMVGSANHTSVPFPSGLVTSQYAGLGLRFPYTDFWPRDIQGSVNTIYGAAAITTVPAGNLSGIDVWAPAVLEESGLLPPSPDAEVDYSGSLTVQFVKLGGTTPTTVASVTVDVQHLPNTLPIELLALDSKGRLLCETTVSSGTPSYDGELLSLSAQNISSIRVLYSDGSTQSLLPEEAPWGVASIEFTPSPDTAPEPCGLILAGFGAAALVGWTWRLRRNRPAFAA